VAWSFRERPRVLERAGGFSWDRNGIEVVEGSYKTVKQLIKTSAGCQTKQKTILFGP